MSRAVTPGLVRSRFGSLAERARSSPESPALGIGTRTVGYGELFQRVREVEAGLRSLGVGKGDVVAILQGNSLAYAELLHAIALRGAIVLPLNTRLTPSEIAFQLAESGAGLIVTRRGDLRELAIASIKLCEPSKLFKASKASKPKPILVDFDEDFVASASPEGEPVEIDPEATLALVYTSGTSGRPKGVMLSRRSFFFSAVGSALHLGMTPGDRWLACMPLFHVGGISILLRSALCGSAAIVQPGFDPRAVDRSLDEEAITLVSLVPTMLRRLLDVRGERRAPETLRCVLLGGASAPGDLLDRARALGFPIACTYGLTEAASQVATQPLDVAMEGTAGLQPLPGTTLRVVNSAGESVMGEPGEIVVSGPTLMSGYFNQPKGTGLRDGWLHTGDIGVEDAKGTLRILDRRSDLIVSGGENVYPAEIEAVLLEHPAVSEVAVAGCADREYGQRPAAWLVAQPGCSVAAAELRRHCDDRLARYKIPVAFRFVAALPRNSAGKLERSRLAALPPTD